MNLRRCVSAVIGLALLSQATIMAQTTLTWKGTASTDWNTAANWNPALVPTALDHVIITTGNVNMPANAVFNAMDWNGGDISGTFNIAGGATLNIGGTVNLDGALTNSGTINWTNGSINVADVNINGGPFVNLGTWNITCDRSFSADNQAGFPTYPNAYAVNSGLVHKTMTTGTTSFGGALFGSPFRNLGTVQVDTGTVEFDSGAPIAGTFTASTASTEVLFFRGIYTATNAALTGPGSFLFKGDSLTLSNDVIANLKMMGGNLFLGPNFQGGSITNLTISGMNLQGTNTLTGALTWSAGHITGVFNVTNSGILTIGGTVFLDAALTNSGTINWTNGSINVADLVTTGGPFVNLGTWNIICDNSFSAESSAGFPTFPNAYAVNSGLVHKITTTGTTTFGGTLFSSPFRNFGTVETDTGAIEFESSGPISGTYTASAANTTIEFFRGNYTATNATVNGAGTVEFVGDTLTLSNDVIANLKLQSGKLFLGPAFQGGSITNLTLTGITLAGTNTVTGFLNFASANGGANGNLTVGSGGQISWLAGDIAGTLMVANNGNLTIGGTVFLDGALTNAGTITWTNGSISVADTVSTAGPLVNLPTGVWNIQCDSSLATDFPPGYPSDTNAYFINQGLFRKTANTGLTQVGFVKSRVILFKNSGGKVEADAGTLSFEGGYLDDGTGMLGFAPAGLSSANFGQIKFDAQPTFSSSLNLSLNTRNGFQFAPGQSFSFLSFPPATNWITCLNGLDLGNGTLFQPLFTATNLSLRSVAYTVGASKPQVFIGRTFGGVSVSWPSAFSAWTLQSATNISASAWTPINACDGNVLAPNNGPQQFFRLMQ